MQESKKQFENFLKYPSLQLPTVDTFRRLPENIASMDWYAAEKLNGTNVSVVLTRSGEFELFNRTVPLEKEEHVNHLQQVIADGLGFDMESVLFLSDYERLHVFGELFGAGIMKMNYTLNEKKEKDFRVFSVFAYKGNGVYDVFSLDYLHKYFRDYLVPIEDFGTLFEMMSLDKDKESRFGGDREGYVLMPVEHVEYDTSLDHPFFNAIKVKYGKYAEKSRARVKTKVELSEESQKLIDDLVEYVTVARVLNVKSHSEMPFERKMIGKWIPLVKEDVYKDFIAEHAEVYSTKHLDDLLRNMQLTSTLMSTISKKIQEAMEQEKE